MTARPILMSAPMVRALLSGAKTQTRRALAPDLFISSGGAVVRMASVGPATTGIAEAHCPYWREPGDTLWVRESLGYCSEYGHYYAADRTFLCSVFDDPEKQTGYSYECAMREGSVPSIHLPRRWSRITLEVTGVRVERLQDISEADAIAEGVSPDPRCRQDDDAAAFHRIGPVRDGSFPIARYAALWESINGPGSWDANPWVWVVEFKRVEA